MARIAEVCGPEAEPNGCSTPKRTRQGHGGTPARKEVGTDARTGVPLEQQNRHFHSMNSVPCLSQFCVPNVTAVPGIAGTNDAATSSVPLYTRADSGELLGSLDNTMPST